MSDQVIFLPGITQCTSMVFFTCLCWCWEK